MPITTESISDGRAVSSSSVALKTKIFKSIEQLTGWLEEE